MQVIGYEKLLYIPLQTCLLPVVTIVPRQIVIKKQKVTIFTANGVTLARTALIMPVAFCLRYFCYDFSNSQTTSLILS